jgi:Mg2+-importing ATPase
VKPRSARKLVDIAYSDEAAALKQLNTQANGLSTAEAAARLKQYGFNDVAREKRLSEWMRLLLIVRNPLIILLVILAIVSFITGNVVATVIIVIMATTSVILRFFQERNADSAAEKLEAMVHTTATALRDSEKKEIPLRELVPGDIVMLSAGDMIPGDIRILSSKDFFVNQAVLTGESMPVEKIPAQANPQIQNALEMPNTCFLGSNVASGTATGIVV